MDEHLGMIGLSEDEERTLKDAKAVREAAQAIISHLEEKSRSASLKGILKRAKVRREANAKIVLEKLPERQTFPKPASRIPRSQRYLWLKEEPQLPNCEAVRETFELVRSFGGLATTYSLDHSQTKKVLRKAGIDIYEEVARQWDSDVPIKELSRQHGVGRDTIARWIKKTGRNIMPRNGNWRYDEALIAKTFDETSSVNKAAKAARVSWDTARSVLSRYKIRAEGRAR